MYLRIVRKPFKDRPGYQPKPYKQVNYKFILCRSERKDGKVVRKDLTSFWQIARGEEGTALIQQTYKKLDVALKRACATEADRDAILASMATRWHPHPTEDEIKALDAEIGRRVEKFRAELQLRAEIRAGGSPRGRDV